MVPPYAMIRCTGAWNHRGHLRRGGRAVTFSRWWIRSESLQRDRRLAYRALKRHFALDDDALEALKDELLYAQAQ